jgi:hypothetical protein
MAVGHDQTHNRDDAPILPFNKTAPPFCPFALADLQSGKNGISHDTTPGDVVEPYEQASHRPGCPALTS